MSHQVRNSFDEHYEHLRKKCEREDLVMFVNACFAATRQNDFYTDQYKTSVSIDFLHLYVMTNYRRLYARTLAAGINHFNQSLIILNLLQAGAPAHPEQRFEEGELIAATLRSLPANRVYKLFASLQKKRVNNRRTRAVVKRYLQWRTEPAFDAIKYRNKYRSAICHVHAKLDDELGKFLFDMANKKKQTSQSLQTELLDKYRQAYYSESAIYELPFTIAESLAEKHSVPRDVFLRKIEHKMTTAEKLRYQTTASRTKGARLDYDLSRASLTKLALYVLSLNESERLDRTDDLHAAFERSAQRALSRSPMSLGRVAAVLDRSRSATGSRGKRNRPFAVALASSYLLREASTEYRSFWTPSTEENCFEFYIQPAGQTALADPLIDALEWNPDLVVIVSDGYENDPPMIVDQVAQVYRDKICKNNPTEIFPEIIHMNPVFDSDHYAPRQLGQTIATVGLRDAEDIATMLGFAKFTAGTSSLAELERYLAYRVSMKLGRNELQHP